MIDNNKNKKISFTKLIRKEYIILFLVFCILLSSIIFAYKTLLNNQKHIVNNIQNQKHSNVDSIRNIDLDNINTNKVKGIVDTNEELDKKIKNLELKEEVTVISSSQYNDIIDNNYVIITLKNNTQKTIKSYTVGFMAFDKNDLPVKIGRFDKRFVCRGSIDQNILPNKTVQSSGGWYLKNSEVNTILSCIETVTYYEDNEVWVNPTYDLWVKRYKEKPLNK